MMVLQDEFKDKMILKYYLSENASYQEVVSYVKTYDRGEIHNFWAKYFLDYDHYNATGHKYVAEILYKTVISVDLDIDK